MFGKSSYMKMYFKKTGQRAGKKGNVCVDEKENVSFRSYYETLKQEEQTTPEVFYVVCTTDKRVGDCVDISSLTRFKTREEACKAGAVIIRRREAQGMTYKKFYVLKAEVLLEKEQPPVVSTILEEPLTQRRNQTQL